MMREVCLNDHPRLKHEGTHLVLALAPGQQLSPAQWERAIRKALKALSMENCLFESWVHTDRDHSHAHVAVSARSITGKRVDRRGDRLKAKKVCRELEKDFGFPSVNNDAKNARRKRPAARADPGVVAEMQRRIGRFVDARGFDRCYTFAQFAMALRQVGVQVVPKIRGGRIVGLGYRMGDTYIRAAELHQSFTFTALKKSGLDWDPARDLPVITQGESHAETIVLPRTRPRGPAAYDTARGWVRNLIDAGIAPARARRLVAGEGPGGVGGGTPGGAPGRSARVGGHAAKGPRRTR